MCLLGLVLFFFFLFLYVDCTLIQLAHLTGFSKQQEGRVTGQLLRPQNIHPICNFIRGLSSFHILEVPNKQSVMMLHFLKISHLPPYGQINAPSVLTENIKKLTCFVVFVYLTLKIGKKWVRIYSTSEVRREYAFMIL